MRQFLEQVLGLLVRGRGGEFEESQGLGVGLEVGREGRGTEFGGVDSTVEPLVVDLDCFGCFGVRVFGTLKGREGGVRTVLLQIGMDHIPTIVRAYYFSLGHLSRPLYLFSRIQVQRELHSRSLFADLKTSECVSNFAIATTMLSKNIFLTIC